MQQRVNIEKISEYENYCSTRYVTYQEYDTFEIPTHCSVSLPLYRPDQKQMEWSSRRCSTFESIHESQDLFIDVQFRQGHFHLVFVEVPPHPWVTILRSYVTLAVIVRLHECWATESRNRPLMLNKISRSRCRSRYRNESEREDNAEGMQAVNSIMFYFEVSEGIGRNKWCSLQANNDHAYA